MFKEGQLLKFSPFIFKNGAQPKPKYFIVLKNVDGELLLATLPTSKDHVPADVPVQWGCVEFPHRCVNVFVFMSGTVVAVRDNGSSFAFPRNTFVYGADLDTYPIKTLSAQIASGETEVEVIGDICPEIYHELTTCLKASRLVKNKYRRLL